MTYKWSGQIPRKTQISKIDLRKIAHMNRSKMTTIKWITNQKTTHKVKKKKFRMFNGEFYQMPKELAWNLHKLFKKMKMKEIFFNSL